MPLLGDPEKSGLFFSVGAVTRFEGKIRARLGAITICIATAAIALGAPPRAFAASPCWKRVLADWQSDRIVAATYRPHCYRTALRHLPTDARTYSDAENAIRRAMLDAVRSGPTHGVKGVQTKLRQLEGTRTRAAAKRAAPAVPAASQQRARPPIPMLVLLCFALALLIAAGVGKVRARMSGEQRRT